MIRRFILPLAVIALAACSSEPAAQQESADDFASRINGGGQKQLDPSQPDPEAPNVAQEAPPKGADLTTLQKLGDIGGVNLGPREGGCTLMVGSDEMIIAAGMGDIDMPAKAVVRVGDSLTMMDSGPGGLASIKRGTTFTGEGFSVKIVPATGDAQSRPATVTVTDNSGNSQSYNGNWICA